MDDGAPSWARQLAEDVDERIRYAEGCRDDLDAGIAALRALRDELAILDAREALRRRDAAVARVVVPALYGFRVTSGSALYRNSLRRRYPWWRRLVVLWPWWP